jgi:hypothetical protein
MPDVFHKSLNLNFFQGVSAGNTHECSLKSRIGEVSMYQKHHDYLIETTILVDLLRDHTQAITWMNSLPPQRRWV